MTDLSRRTLLKTTLTTATGAGLMTAIAVKAAPVAAKGLDPEYEAILENFEKDSAQNCGLDPKRRMRVVLAGLLGCQGREEFELQIPKALDAGLTPVEIKEIIYQATAYLGIGRVRGFTDIANRVFSARGIELPLESQAQKKDVARAVKGEAAQVKIFGDRMKGFATSDKDKTRPINRWLSENCFGDYYVRGGLDLKERELLTFCYLAAQGDTPNEMMSHAAGNFRMGNDEKTLISAVLALVPFLGYPRSLNSLAIIAKAAEAK